MEKINIYIDCDNTILNIQEEMRNYLEKENKTNNFFSNTKYNTSRDFVKVITPERFYTILNKDGFRKNLKVNNGFIEFYNQTKDLFNWKFVINSHYSKYVVLLSSNGIDNVEFITLKSDIEKEYEEGFIYQVLDGIYIHSNVKELDCSKASLKILMDDQKRAIMNPITAGIGCYVIEDWHQMSEIIGFIVKHRELFDL